MVTFWKIFTRKWRQDAITITPEYLFQVICCIIGNYKGIKNKTLGDAGSISEEDLVNVADGVRRFVNILLEVSCIISILYIDISLTPSALQMSCHTG